MSVNPTAPISPAAAPQAAATIPLPQPQWEPGLTNAQWEQRRPLRDASINSYLSAAIAERRRNGTPLANEPLYSPLDRDGYVSDDFGTRTHPVTGRSNDPHAALDITTANKDNVNVAAMRSGTVIYRGSFSPQAGYSIMVLDDNGEINFYAHLEAGSFEHIRPGERVRQGQLIGVMGRSGSATERHVHITVRRLTPEALAQSARSQVQQVDLTGLMVQPLPMREEDPALTYTMYDNINPPIVGRAGDRIPAPPRAVLMAGNPLPREEDFFPPAVVATVPPVAPLPATQVDETPGQSNLPGQGPRRSPDVTGPLPPF